MRSYNSLYVSVAQNRLGSMLDYAVNGLGLQLGAFYKMFLDSGLAERFGNGEPGVIAGRSGIELTHDVITQAKKNTADEDGGELASIPDEGVAFAPVNGASPEYWTGWALAYYQWESCSDFCELEELVPIEQIIRFYHPYHEMDVTSFCDLMDKLCFEAFPQTHLQARRMKLGLSQSQLAFASGVPVRTLQQYEQRQKDINKAQVQYVAALARVLHCNIEDLLERKSTPHYEYRYITF